MGSDDERLIFIWTVEGNSTIDLIEDDPADKFSIAELLLSVNNMSVRSLILSLSQILALESLHGLILQRSNIFINS